MEARDKGSGPPPNKYLKEKGVFLVDEYASIGAKIRELGEQEERLEKELGLKKEAAVECARREGITSITSSGHVLKIMEGTSLAFPPSGQEEREELERFIRKAGLWEETSIINLSRPGELLENEDLNPIWASTAARAEAPLPAIPGSGRCRRISMWS